MKYGKYSKNGMLIIESRYIGHSSYSIDGEEVEAEEYFIYKQ